MVKSRSPCGPRGYADGSPGRGPRFRGNASRGPRSGGEARYPRGFCQKRKSSSEPRQIARAPSPPQVFVRSAKSSCDLSKFPKGARTAPPGGAHASAETPHARVPLWRAGPAPFRFSSKAQVFLRSRGFRECGRPLPAAGFVRSAKSSCELGKFREGARTFLRPRAHVSAEALRAGPASRRQRGQGPCTSLAWLTISLPICSMRTTPMSGRLTYPLVSSDT